MKEFFRRGLRVVAGLVLSACTVGVVVGAQPARGAGAVRDPVSAEQARASMQAALNASRVARGSNQANDAYANPYRAYPASCLSDGLPLGDFKQFTSDPAPQQKQLTVPTCSVSNPSSCNTSETVTVSVWRVPCSPDAAGHPQSATLMEIDRPCGANCGNSTVFATFPLVLATQGNNSNISIRVANDPNTWYSTTYVNTPIYYSDIWVLENYFLSSIQFDYNQAFALALDNTIQFDVPAYNPAQYAGNSQSLPISGYMTSNWYSPGHGGEGMLTQVFDNPGSNPVTRTFTAAWYTFDKAGLPFWLFAQGTLTAGDRTTGPVDTYYPTGGTFAGAAGPGATFTKWGTVTFSFPDCNHMAFTFNGNADAVNGPTSNGTESRTWVRIANVNSIVCD